MNGIVACFTGRLGQDGELRYLASGAGMLSFSVAVDSQPKDGRPEPPQWCRVAYFREDAADLAPRLVKGSEVYVEGSLKLNEWQSQDGRAHSGLNVNAWRIEVLGQIGRRGPQRQRDQVDRGAMQRYTGAPA